MDAISILKDDHKAVEQLFKRFEKAGDRAHVEKRQIVDRIIEELSKHAAVEEQLFYPVVRATVPATEDIALESLEEHHIVKWLLSELETLATDAERFDAKVTVLMENVRHHVKEEENDFFPKVRKAIDRASLNDLGDLMSEAKKTAPTHPHPRSPDTPPGNAIMGTASGVADRVADTMNGLAQGGVNAVGDIIATVLGRKRPKVSPTGSMAARKTASELRGSTADATDAVIDAVRKAKDVGTRTTRAVASSTKTSTKRTARTATRGAARTARTATSVVKATSTPARKTAAARKAAAARKTTAVRKSTAARKSAAARKTTAAKGRSSAS